MRRGMRSRKKRKSKRGKRRIEIRTLLGVKGRKMKMKEKRKR